MGLDLAKLEAKNEAFADTAEGDSTGEETIRSLAGEKYSPAACLLLLLGVS